MANNISIHIEGGYLQIRGQIPVVNADEAVESFVQELKFQLFGDAQVKKDQPAVLAPRDLDEKDAAKYIGRSVSFLRGCRYSGKNKGKDPGPKYTRVSPRCIRYPVHELDKWLENCRLYGACCEEGAWGATNGTGKPTPPTRARGKKNA